MRLLTGIAICAVLALIYAMSDEDEHRLSSFATSLEGRSRSQRHNSSLALAKLNGTVVLPGETFSFNGRVGTYSRDAGYRKAPVSYNGQLIASWGGGVCQTSTTLYNTALLAGMEIVTRSRHRFAPSYVQPGRDAAVAFDAIDLEFRNPYDFPVRIRGAIDGDKLVIGIYGPQQLEHKPHVVQVVRQITNPRVLAVGSPGSSGRIRNSGKQGCDVTVYRYIDGQREFISSDHYPVMHQVVDYR